MASGVRPEGSNAGFDLPSGGWAAFHDPATLTAAQLRPLRRMQLRFQTDSILQAAVAGALGERARRSVFDDYSVLSAATLLSGWSLDAPATLEGLRSLFGSKDYQAILDAAEEHESALLPPNLIDVGAV